MAQPTPCEAAWRGKNRATLDADCQLLDEPCGALFRDITEDVIREESFAHVLELVDDMELYLKQRDAEPQPYRWNAKGEEILEKIKRAREKPDQVRLIHSIAEHYTSEDGRRLG